MDLDYQEIGRNIRRFRQAKGLKQKELAELIQVSDQHVSHIENAHTQVSLPTLVAIANVLQTDCNTLLGRYTDRGQAEYFAPTAAGAHSGYGYEEIGPHGPVLFHVVCI